MGFPTKPARTGQPGCPQCGGDGTVRVQREDDGPPVFQLCRCTLRSTIIANVERGMRGLSKARPIKETRLAGLEHEDLWVTAPKYTFMAHLRHIAIRKPPTWGFKVVSDAQLMTAWLATASLAGSEIFDADAVKTSLTHATLVDLVDPPELLIIRLGVKAARNEAMPEVLLEALTHREHTAQPTWLWDQPHHPLDGGGHLSYSDQVAEQLEEWRRLHITEEETPRGRKAKPTSPGPHIPARGRPTLSQATGTTTAEKKRPAPRKGTKGRGRK